MILFKSLATLRTDALLFANVDDLERRGPTPRFEDWAARIDDKRLLARCVKAASGPRDPRRAAIDTDERLIKESAPPT